MEELAVRAENLASLSAQENPFSMHWSILLEGKTIGRLSILNYNHHSGPLSELEYYLSPKFAGQGFTTEAVQLILEVLKRPLKATVHPEHVASIAILSRLGFKKTSSAFYGPARWDTYLYTP